MNEAIDLSLISDEDLSREYWRRAHAARKTSGRPKKMSPCHKCGAQLSARELKSHLPQCEYPRRFFIDRPESSGAKLDKGESGQHAEYVTAEGIRLAWSGGMPLPNIGATVDITMNNIGLAHVKGYFMEGGWLGVMTKAINPPAWLRKQKQEQASDATLPQWRRDGIGCEFGVEIAAINTGRKK